MRISIISDEISTDFQQALKFALQWGIRDFEIRNLKSGKQTYCRQNKGHNPWMIVTELQYLTH